MQKTVGDIAKLIGGKVLGDDTQMISEPAGIDSAQPGTISFLSNLKYLPFLYSTKASAVIVDHKLDLKPDLQTTVIQVPDVNVAITTLINAFSQRESKNQEIHTSAIVHTSVKIDADVAIGPLSIVMEGTNIGPKTTIHSQVYIGENVQIGAQCVIYPGVRIFDNTVIGDSVILHANAVIGDDGFGFIPNEKGEYQKVKHIGKVIIEDDVEIGNNTTIDRGTMGATIIRKGVKLDNLIHVAHNVEIDEHTVIAAQTGISGSTKIGKKCIVGGQVGFIGHITIADQTQIQAQSGVAQSIKEEKTRIYGSPAISYFNYLRSFAIFKKLPFISKEIDQLKDKLNK